MITRKAIGGSYVAMSSKQMGNDIAFAWPSAQIAVMGAEGAAKLLYGKAIAAAEDPAKAEAEFIADYKERLFNPYQAADVGQVDEVIDAERDPAATDPGPGGAAHQGAHEHPQEARAVPGLGVEPWTTSGSVSG